MGQGWHGDEGQVGMVLLGKGRVSSGQMVLGFQKYGQIIFWGMGFVSYLIGGRGSKGLGASSKVPYLFIEFYIFASGQYSGCLIAPQFYVNNGKF